MFQRLFRFRIRTLLVAVFFAALFAKFVIVPEIQRTNTFENLEAEGVSIGPPWVNMFSGGPPNQAPVPKPFWFGPRQTLASLCGIKTIPWCYGTGTLDLPNDKLGDRESLVGTQSDLAGLLVTTRQYYQPDEDGLVPMPHGYYRVWIDPNEANP